MAEYVLGEDENQEKVVQELLANANHPDDVVWRPRSGVPHGGVYEIQDELMDRLVEHRRAQRAAETERTEARIAAADERDATPAVAEGLVTPAEAGFAANAQGDPGAFRAADDGAQGDADAQADARAFDADTLSDEEWAAKYPDQERPESDSADLPEAEDEGTPATNRKRARRAKTTTAADGETEEGK